MKNIKIVVVITVELFFLNFNIEAQKTDTLVHQTTVYINTNGCHVGYNARAVKYLYAILGGHYAVPYNVDCCLWKTNSISQKNFLLSIQTSDISFNKNTYCSLDFSVGHRRDLYDKLRNYKNDDNLRKKNVEMQIAENYCGRIKQEKNVVYVDTVIPHKPGSVDFNLMIVEYRTDGVKNLKISANRQIFGQKTGKDLSGFFRIKNFGIYDMPYIIDAQTDSLLYGPSNQRRGESAPTSIEEWLKLNPLAQPAMILQFNRKIPEKLPVKVQFFVEMETDKGVVLRDTTGTVIITR